MNVKALMCKRYRYLILFITFTIFLLLYIKLQNYFLNNNEVYNLFHKESTLKIENFSIVNKHNYEFFIKFNFR